MKRTITNAEAIQMAEVSITASGDSDAQFARILGVSRGYLCHMLKGRKSAAPIAAHFGYTIQTFTKPERAAKYLAERKAQ